MSDELKRRLEPGLMATNEGAVMSIAISLKRIADRLDDMTNYFADDKAQLRVFAEGNIDTMNNY